MRCYSVIRITLVEESILRYRRPVFHFKLRIADLYKRATHVPDCTSIAASIIGAVSIVNNILVKTIIHGDLAAGDVAKNICLFLRRQNA